MWPARPRSMKTRMFCCFFAPCFTFKTCFDPKHIHQANPVSLAMQESVWSWPLGHHKKISFFAEPKCEYQNISMKACKEHKSLTLGPTTSFFLWGPPFHMFDTRCRDHKSSNLCPTKNCIFLVQSQSLTAFDQTCKHYFQSLTLHPTKT